MNKIKRFVPTSTRIRGASWVVTALLGMTVGLVGCGSLRTSHVITGFVSEPTWAAVTIVLEGAPVPADVDEVAIVQAVGSGTEARMPVIIAGLKREAQELGCDMVVRVRIDQGSSIATASGVAARTRRSRLPAP